MHCSAMSLTPGKLITKLPRLCSTANYHSYPDCYPLWKMTKDVYVDVCALDTLSHHLYVAIFYQNVTIRSDSAISGLCHLFRK